MMELTKKQFVRFCFILIGIGIFILTICYYLLSKQLTTNQLSLLGIMSCGLLICGFGVGLAYSRMYLIKDFERRLNNGNKRELV